MHRLSICILVCALAGCGGEFPRDADQTTRRMRGAVMLVGASHDPPHVVVPVSGPPSGSDIVLVEAFARQQGARIEWVRGDHDGLMRDLEARRLQAVVGGNHVDSPWLVHVASTRPFDAVDAHGRKVKRVIAMPPGENAWLMRLDTLLHEAGP